MDHESVEVFESWRDQLPEEHAGGSGIPKDFVFGSTDHQVFRDRDRVVIYPPDGGSIILSPDGTWVGDIAPFAD